MGKSLDVVIMEEIIPDMRKRGVLDIDTPKNLLEYSLSKAKPGPLTIGEKIFDYMIYPSNNFWNTLSYHYEGTVTYEKAGQFLAKRFNVHGSDRKHLLKMCQIMDWHSAGRSTDELVAKERAMITPSKIDPIKLYHQEEVDDFVSFFQAGSNQ